MFTSSTFRLAGRTLGYSPARLNPTESGPEDGIALPGRYCVDEWRVRDTSGTSIGQHSSHPKRRFGRLPIEPHWSRTRSTACLLEVKSVRYQITCARRRFGIDDPYERLEALGSSKWYGTVQQVIREIESQRNSYYVTVAGRPTEVVVEVHAGRKYLTTAADRGTPESLLLLPECTQGDQLRREMTHD